MDEFLKKIGINKPGEYSQDGSYVVDIDDYDEYGKFYSILDKSDLVDEIVESSQLTIHTTSLLYMSDEYQISLLADLDNDQYKLVVTDFE